MTSTQKFLTCVTPVILTFNEAPNIGRALAKLAWAREVVVVDSGSNDGTLEILAGHQNVRCIRRPFDSHARQWSFAVNETGIASDWVLALDADYLLTDALVQEIAALDPSADVVGYETAFRYCIWGRPLRGSLYPPVTTLYRRVGACYEQDGHTQRLKLAGTVGRLHGCIWHDDRKPLARWLASQDRYAQLECELLLGQSWSALRWRDRLRRMMVVTPWLVPLYCLTVGHGLLDGRIGWYYALQRGIAESILSLKLFEAKWQGHKREQERERSNE